MEQRQKTYKAESVQLEAQAQQVMDDALANPDQAGSDLARIRAGSMRSQALLLRAYDEPNVVSNCILAMPGEKW